MAKKRSISPQRERGKKAKSKRAQGIRATAKKPTKSGSVVPQTQSAEEPSQSRRPKFPIACLGASAGGLEALQEFFDHMPADGDVGFVVVTHQHPGHTSLLSELLARHTNMPVVELTDGTQVESNHVYVSPPGTKLGLLNDTVAVTEITVADGEKESRQAKARDGPDLPAMMPIDQFLRSMANDLAERAICIILSGTGSDGTIGLAAIKAAGGMTIVQQPESAKYDGMPRSAIGTGMADFVLPPREMSFELCAYVNGPFLRAEPLLFPDQPLRQILLLLKTQTGNDFSSYKSTTLRRRIERRMQIRQMACPNAYVKFLQENPREIELLFKELLISVTSFFRDPEAFAVLSDAALSRLIESRPDGYTFRAWVPGCATGEEAYSLAILLREIAEKHEKNVDYQIFATDLDASAIETARNGVYPDSIAQDVGDVRLKRFFHRENSMLRVRKHIREMIVFAPQNVIKDPAFTRLDLLCCRNLLIYLEAELQQRLLPIFHHALIADGLLMLGPSETIGADSDLFEPIDKKWKIYRRKQGLAALGLPATPAQPVPRQGGADLGEGRNETGREAVPLSAASSAKAPRLTKQIERLLLSQFAPASVVVAESGEIVYVHGRTGMYLELASGQAEMNVLDMARDGLRNELAACLRRAKTDAAAACRDGVRVKTNGGYGYVNLSVQRIVGSSSIRDLFLITFRPVTPPVPDPGGRNPKRKQVIKEEAGKPGKKGKQDPTAQLQRELQYTKESLQATIEELELSNEELKIANEELQSSNEEHQSTIEELETSKEEMQSLNEELNTVNSEMQAKFDELADTQDDMQNLLNSTDIATVFVDKDLCVKRFTPSVRKLIRLLDSDIGRPLSDLKSNIKYDSLEEDARAVLQTLVFREGEVQTPEGQRYQVRIIPYRTARNVVSGLVLTFVNIQAQVEAAEQREASVHAICADIVQTVREPLTILDHALRVVKCNRSFYDLYGLREDEVEQKPIFEISDGAWNAPEFRRLLEEILPQQSTMDDFEFVRDFPGRGRKHLILNARRLDRDPDLPAMVLLAIEDVTKQEAAP